MNNMHPKDLRIEDYTYLLPEEKIAKYPLPERDASRLLVYKDGLIANDTYRDLPQHIPAGTLMVFNQTRVVHARLIFKKPTGGSIEIFCLGPGDSYPGIQSAMQQKGSVTWNCLIGGAAKWKAGTVPELYCESGGFTLRAGILERRADHFVVELAWDREDLSFAEVLHHAGRVPLPPYMQRAPVEADENRYQTIFAREEGSVAAPTAGLHFTDRVLKGLAEKQVDTTFVTLHVGAGTFRPVKSETMADHDMHAEWIEITIPAIETLVSHLDRGIIATGTTTLRTLESLYHIGRKLLNGWTPDPGSIAVTQWEPYEQNDNPTPAEALNAIIDYLRGQGRDRLVTRTQLLIAPGYTFRIAKGLVTNFHQPGSTLLLLVAAFIGEDWKKVYDHALKENYRFLSYGDGCLFLRS